MNLLLDEPKRCNSPIKIVILSQWFPPEHTPIGYMYHELANHLVSRGHDVTVITGFPNHPEGKVFDGFHKRWRQDEEKSGYKIIRMWLFTKCNPTPFSRILTFLSFTFTSAWAILNFKKFDLLFAGFQPLSLGITLPLLAKVKSAKLILNVQDLHPDVPIELGLISNPLLISVLRSVEKRGYQMADGLAVISEGFRKHCVDRGANPKNIEVIPNWIDTKEIKPGNRMNAFREELGLTDQHIVVLYAGTIGLISGADIVVSVAQELAKSHPFVCFVFVGGGPALPEIKNKVKECLITNVKFATFQSREHLSDVQAMADISLVTLRRGKGRTSVPSKVLGYMAAARPVVASVDGESETASLLTASGCGLVTQPENAHLLAASVRRLADSQNERFERGQAGRLFLVENFSKEKITRKYADFFKRIYDNEI